MVERVRSTRKRIMRELRIAEISAVDYPSVRPARAVIMKQESDIMRPHRIGDDSVASFDTLDEAVATIAAIETVQPARRHGEGGRAAPRPRREVQ